MRRVATATTPTARRVASAPTGLVNVQAGATACTRGTIANLDSAPDAGTAFRLPRHHRARPRHPRHRRYLPRRLDRLPRRPHHRHRRLPRRRPRRSIASSPRALQRSGRQPPRTTSAPASSRLNGCRPTCPDRKHSSTPATMYRCSPKRQSASLAVSNRRPHPSFRAHQIHRSRKSRLPLQARCHRHRIRRRRRSTRHATARWPPVLQRRSQAAPRHAAGRCAVQGYLPRHHLRWPTHRPRRSPRRLRLRRQLRPLPCRSPLIAAPSAWAARVATSTASWHVPTWRSSVAGADVVAAARSLCTSGCGLHQSRPRAR